jgi:hypothetical protein
MLVYAECGCGACIRDYPNLESAEKGILKEVGTREGVSICRWATQNDLNWVKAMGGMIPTGKLKKQI